MSDVLTLIFDFLIRTKKSVISIFVLAFSGPCASLIHWSWPKWVRDQKTLIYQLVYLKLLPLLINRGSRRLGSAQVIGLPIAYWPSGNICSLFKSIWQGFLPKFLRTVTPNSSELDFDPNPLSGHWILPFILTTLQAGILINCVAPSQTCTLIDTPSKTLEHQLPYPMPESELLRDWHQWISNLNMAILTIGEIQTTYLWKVASYLTICACPSPLKPHDHQKLSYLAWLRKCSLYFVTRVTQRYFKYTWMYILCSKSGYLFFIFIFTLT